MIKPVKVCGKPHLRDYREVARGADLPLLSPLKPGQKFHIGKPNEWEVETTVKEWKHD